MKKIIAPVLLCLIVVIFVLMYFRYSQSTLAGKSPVMAESAQTPTEKAVAAPAAVTSATAPIAPSAPNLQTPTSVPPASQANLPVNAKVNFVSPKDGSTVPQKFKVAFMVDGLKLEKAGVANVGRGHYNLIIDATPTPAGQIVERDRSHIHFDEGQSDAEINLTPGKHTLSVQFSDGAQISYGPRLSKSIKIEVK